MKQMAFARAAAAGSSQGMGAPKDLWFIAFKELQRQLPYDALSLSEEDQLAALYQTRDFKAAAELDEQTPRFGYPFARLFLLAQQNPPDISNDVYATVAVRLLDLRRRYTASDTVFDGDQTLSFLQQLDAVALDDLDRPLRPLHKLTRAALILMEGRHLCKDGNLLSPFEALVSNFGFVWSDVCNVCMPVVHFALELVTSRCEESLSMFSGKAVTYELLGGRQEIQGGAFSELQGDCSAHEQGQQSFTLQGGAPQITLPGLASSVYALCKSIRIASLGQVAANLTASRTLLYLVLFLVLLVRNVDAKRQTLCRGVSFAGISDPLAPLPFDMFQSQQLLTNTSSTELTATELTLGPVKFDFRASYQEFQRELGQAMCTATVLERKQTEWLGFLISSKVQYNPTSRVCTSSFGDRFSPSLTSFYTTFPTLISRTLVKEEEKQIRRLVKAIKYFSSPEGKTWKFKSLYKFLDASNASTSLSDGDKSDIILAMISMSTGTIQSVSDLLGARPLDVVDILKKELGVGPYDASLDKYLNSKLTDLELLESFMTLHSGSDLAHASAVPRDIFIKYQELQPKWNDLSIKSQMELIQWGTRAERSEDLRRGEYLGPCNPFPLSPLTTEPVVALCSLGGRTNTYSIQWYEIVHLVQKFGSKVQFADVFRKPF